MHQPSKSIHVISFNDQAQGQEDKNKCFAMVESPVFPQGEVPCTCVLIKEPPPPIHPSPLVFTTSRVPLIAYLVHTHHSYEGRKHARAEDPSMNQRLYNVSHHMYTPKIDTVQDCFI